MGRKRVTDWPVYLLVRLSVCLIQSMRLETCQSLSRLLAWVACDLAGIRRQVVDENLRLAFPQLSGLERRHLARRMWEHLLLMVCEIAHAPRKIHRSNWSEHIRFVNKRELVRYLLEPRPVVLISGHFGNFELAGFMTGLLGFPTYTVARPLDNRHLDRYVSRFRSANGQHLVSTKGSARQIDALLSSGAALAMLGDQHAGSKGCWVEFFGREASCHKAIALFPLTSGAPLLVSYGRRLDQPLCFEIGLVGVADPAQPLPEMDSIPSLTQWYNRLLEQVIRVSPEQYWWLHRRWKEPPPRRQTASQAA